MEWQQMPANDWRSLLRCLDCGRAHPRRGKLTELCHGGEGERLLGRAAAAGAAAYLALVPFPGQDSRWPKASRDAYAQVLAHAAGVYTCHAERPATDQQAGDLLKARDEVLCCVSDELIAVFDGSSGGTSHTVRKWDGFGGRGRLHRIDPRDLR